MSSPCPHSRSGGRWIQQCMIKGSQGLETSPRLFDVTENCSPRDAWDVYCLCSPLLPLVGLLPLVLITSPGQGHLKVPARLPTHTPRTQLAKGSCALAVPQWQGGDVELFGSLKKKELGFRRVFKGAHKEAATFSYATGVYLS